MDDFKSIVENEMAYAIALVILCVAAFNLGLLIGWLL